MKMIRAVRYFLRFYLGFLPASWLISGICICTFHALFSTYGWGPFMYLFWFKIFSLGLIWYVIDHRKKQEYYYYFNLGLSKTLLWSVSLSFDFGLFMILWFLLAPQGPAIVPPA